MDASFSINLVTVIVVTMEYTFSSVNRRMHLIPVFIQYVFSDVNLSMTKISYFKFVSEFKVVFF